MNALASSFLSRLMKKRLTLTCDPNGPVSINIRNLSVNYPNTSVISGLSCHFGEAALWAITGPNGAGKSTLLKAILGLQYSIQGQIMFRGVCPCDVAYLAQQNQLDRRFPLNVRDTVAMGLFRRVGLFRSYTKEQKDKVQEALHKVGLSRFANVPLQALSGGQFQRVLFARLILQDASIILLDEPFTGVDNRTLEDLMLLLRQWVEEGRLVIVVLHHLDLVQKHFPQTLMLARHFYKTGKTKDVLTAETLQGVLEASRQWESEIGQKCD